MFNIEEAISGLQIVYPHRDEAAVSMRNPTTTALDETYNQSVSPQLELPWHEKYWNLYITHPKSTVEVWARIIGSEYSVGVVNNYTNQSIDDHFLHIDFLCFL